VDVRLGFSPEPELWSEPTLASLSGGTDALVQGATTFLSEAWVSAKLCPVPVVVEEAMAVEERAAKP
jgi:hypothetical protein